MLDITAEGVEVSVSADGETLWVNTMEGCVLRINKIKDLIIADARSEDGHMTLEYLKNCCFMGDGVADE